MPPDGKRKRRQKNPDGSMPAIKFAVKNDGTSGYHRMLIKITPPDGITRVDAAYISPSGSRWMQKAKRINDTDYEINVKRDEEGEFLTSIAAYNSKGIVNMITGNYSFMPGAKSRGQERRKTQILEIPDPPPEIRNGIIRTWPVSSAYSKSLQNVSYSISEKYPERRESKLVANPNVKFTSDIHGSGNFGVVFKIERSGNFHAVKCFTRASADIAERYYFLSAYLSKANLPFLVSFNYLTDAVRVVSKPKDYFPVLVMDWVEGQTLNQFIISNLQNSELLRKFATGFIASVEKMQSLGIAHGDLSGDNILVDDTGSHKFIDYDGMFVPPLSGRKSQESGHEHFQHPGRTDEFTGKLDNFSALVIYLSILAVSENPEMWGYNGEDQDRLIFSSSDFKDPENSKLFSDLNKMSKRIRKLSALMQEALKQKPLWEGISPSVIRNQ